MCRWRNGLEGKNLKPYQLAIKIKTLIDTKHISKKYLLVADEHYQKNY